MSGFVGMKKHLIISLFLLTVCGVVPLVAQEKNDFVTETIKLENLKIPAAKREKFLSDFFRPLLTTAGSVKFDERNQTFVFTDTKYRVDFIKRFGNILENSGLTAKDFSTKPGKDKKRVTEIIYPGVMVFIIGCDVGEESAWALRSLKKELLLKTIEATRVQVKWAQTDVVGMELTGNRKRVELAKKIITLFDGNDIL